jgi:hypothetical protein
MRVQINTAQEAGLTRMRVYLFYESQEMLKEVCFESLPSPERSDPLNQK